MKQRDLRISTSICMLLSFLFFTMIAPKAWAQVQYLEYNTSTTAYDSKTVSSYTAVTSSTTTMSNGWYVVSNTVTVGSRINISGTVNLILCNGCTLTASQGIKVSSGNTLNIYGQSGSTGTLIAKGYRSGNGGESAAIGSNNDQTIGTINIHGGIINATENVGWSAGIGGGIRGGGGTIRLYGGTITAVGAGGGGSSNGSEAIGKGADGGSVSKSIADRLRVRTGNNTTPVASGSRISSMSPNNQTIHVEPCTSHNFSNNVCTYCNAQRYQITYNSNNATSGTAPTDANLYIKGDNTTVTVLGNTGNLARTGYTFGGWNTKNDGTGTNYNPGATFTTTNSVTLYAKWTPITYSVRFNSNASDASGSMSDQTHTYNATQNLTANAFTRSNYVFLGWAETPDGPVIYTDGQSVSNLSVVQGTVINLYAKWTHFLTLYNDIDNSTAIAAAAAISEPYAVLLANRKFYLDNTWNTICLPFNLSSFTGTPLEGATVKSLVSSNYSDGTLTMNFSDNLTAIEAGKPYIVKWTDPTVGADLVIHNAAEWNTFATNVTNGTESYQGKIVKLAADITVTTMAGGGTSGKFKGTFDGCGHTLTFNYTSTAQYCAPFRYTDGATFKNLRVAGTITTSKDDAAGITAHCVNGCTIENCRVSITISSTFNGGAADGGFIALIDNHGATFTNCIFDGKLLGSSTNKSGGYVGWCRNGYTVTLTNCVFAAEEVTFGASEWTHFCRGNSTKTYTNCYYNYYYNNNLNTTVGEMTAAQLATTLGDGWEVRGGKVVPKMRSYMVNPMFTDVHVSDVTPSSAVFTGSYATFTGGNYVFDAHNPNGDAIHAALNVGNPTQTGYTFGGWCTDAARGNVVTVIPFDENGNVTLYEKWALTLQNDDRTETTKNTDIISAAVANSTTCEVTLADRTFYRDNTWNSLCLPFNLSDFAGTPLEGATVKTLESSTYSDGALTLSFSDASAILAGKPYFVKWAYGADLIIRSAEDWNTFATNVNNGSESYVGKVVKLAADISISTIAGNTSDHPFMGTFDGCGHTLNVNITDESNQGTAPFRYISGAIIQNVRTKGTVRGNLHCSGLVGFAQNTNTIRNCEVAVSVICSGGNHSHCGGILGHGLSSTTTIRDCLFSGSISGTTTATGIIYGWTGNGTHTVINCLADGIYTNCTGLDVLYKYQGTTTVTNSYKTQNVGSTGTFTTATGSSLVALLGDGWELSGGKVVPKMTNTVNDIANPAFANVTISNTNADVNTHYADFVGYFSSPTNIDGLLFDAHNPDGDAMHAALSIDAPVAPAGHTFGGWCSDAERTALVTTFPFADITSNVTLYAKWAGYPLELANHADNGETISQAAGDGKFYDVTLANRTIYRDSTWNTICLPFDLDDFTGTPLQGATVKTLESSVYNDGTLTMNFSDNLSAIEAGKPYIVKWPADLVISSQEEWNAFASNVTNGTTYQGKIVKLAADITVTTMAGSSESNSFRGTFDGCGHTLSLNISATTNVVAPFQYINGATIRNLTIGGSINNSGKQNGGVAGFSYGSVIISNCVVSASISSGFNGDSSNGGFIADIKSGSVTFDNCAFTGKLLGTKATCFGGFVGWRSNANSQIVFNHCLLSPTQVTMSTSGSSTFNRRGTDYNTYNCYYRTAYGAEQGTQTSATGSDLQTLLGDGWGVDGDNVVPKMVNSVSNIENPVFADVTISNATANVTTTAASFIGSYAPITDNSLLRDAHNPNGDAQHASLSIDISNPTVPTGYSAFAGWYTDAEKTDTVGTIPFATNGNVTLYAKYTPITYSVRFNKNSDAASGTMANQEFTYDVAQELTANSFTTSTAGYEFKGWGTTTDGEVTYTDEQSVSNLASVQDDVVDLYAQWGPIVYPITYTLKCFYSLQILFMIIQILLIQIVLNIFNSRHMSVHFIHHQYYTKIFIKILFNLSFYFLLNIYIHNNLVCINYIFLIILLNVYIHFLF